MRLWLIRLLAGKTPVCLNVTIDGSVSAKGHGLFCGLVLYPRV